jgi:hypothetical protein
VATECDLVELHAPHPFGRGSLLLFETNQEDTISALTIRLEPAAAPIRFEKKR